MIHAPGNGSVCHDLGAVCWLLGPQKCFFPAQAFPSHAKPSTWSMHYVKAGLRLAGEGCKRGHRDHSGLAAAFPRNREWSWATCLGRGLDQVSLRGPFHLNHSVVLCEQPTGEQSALFCASC